MFGRRNSTSIATGVAAGAAAVGVLALCNHLMARRAERKHPATGSFIEVDGVRLHYTDQGAGTPVVLIHGNMVTGNDYETSGVAAALADGHRVIIFDRPGFGHSDRPRGRLWTVNQQADLLQAVLKQLQIETPVVVGHSFGAIIAIAMAVRHEADVAGVVAVSGYYFWTWRPDVLLAGLGAMPIVGDILRYTISPLVNWLMMPLVKRALFSPGAVPRPFDAEFSTAMAIRPSQIRATAEDGALMIPGALSLRGKFERLTLPVAIIAGEGDKVVFKRRSEQLRAAVERSTLEVVPGGGHMVHHQAPQQVVQAVEAVFELSTRLGKPGLSTRFRNLSRDAA